MKLVFGPVRCLRAWHEGRIEISVREVQGAKMIEVRIEWEEGVMWLTLDLGATVFV